MENEVQQITVGNTGWLVYAGEIDNDSYLYYVLGNLERNNGVPAKGLRTFGSSKKIFDSGIGAITEVTFTDIDQISYKKNALPAAFWKCSEDLTAWRIKNTAIATGKKLKKQSKDDHLEELLKPVRDQYDKARTRDEKRIMLAEVIRIITS